MTNSQRQRLPPALIKSPLTSSAPSPGAQLDSELVITADKDLSKWEMWRVCVPPMHSPAGGDTLGTPTPPNLASSLGAKQGEGHPTPHGCWCRAGPPLLAHACGWDEAQRGALGLPWQRCWGQRETGEGRKGHEERMQQPWGEGLWVRWVTAMAGC